MGPTLPKDYFDARTRFLETAQSGFQLFSYQLSESSQLACDVAVYHPEGAKIALVTTSGVHGVEGYAGSALQTFYMQNAPRDKKIAQIHVHALNPAGFAADRRTDGENMDVNRNFLPSYPEQRIADAYAEFAEIIVPRSGKSGVMHEIALAALAITKPMQMKDIITRGQTSCDVGMYYTGLKPSWSRLTWEQIIAEHLSRYQHVIHLDIHTGLGKSSEMQLMGVSPQDRSARLAQDVWGDKLAFMYGADGTNGTLSSRTIGEIQNSWSLVSGPRPQDAATFTMEFGTLPPLDVFKALRADHMAYARGENDPDVMSGIRSQMRRAFAPSEVDWLNQVLIRGDTAYRLMLRELEIKGFDVFAPK